MARGDKNATRHNRCKETEIRDVRPDSSRRTEERLVRCVLEQGHEGRCEYKGRLFGESRCLAKEERFVYKGQYSHTIEVQCSGARGHSGTVHWHRGKKFAGQIDFPG